MSTSLERLRASRLGHGGPRHPLCPKCRYDLVATIAARGRRCPECGTAFETDELVTEARADDWTLWRGVRQASLVLLGKGLICAGAWGLALVAQHHLSLFLRGAAWPGYVIIPLNLATGLLVLATGGAVGAVLVRRIDEHLGFAGLGVALVLIAVAGLVLSLGTMLANQLGASPSVLGLLIACLVSTAFIVKTAFLDEQ